MVDHQILCRSMILGQVLPCTQVEEELLQALEHLPRHKAVAHAWQNLAYADKDTPLEEGRFLMAAMPFVRLVRLAKIVHGERVLDVGCGAGYTSLVLRHLTPHVVGLEKSESLVARAQAFDQDHGGGRHPVQFLAKADPFEGAPEAGPFDVIVVEGALPCVPQTLVTHLSQGGRLVCFVAGEKSSLATAILVTKQGENISVQRVFEASASSLVFDVRKGEAHHVAA